MSTSDLYILNGKSTTHFAGFKNGWGSGPICWDYLSIKYLGDSKCMSGDMKNVWGLARDERVAHHEKVALMMTFDKAFIPLGALQDASKSLEKFGKECEDGRRVNHWPDISVALGQLFSMKHHRAARGVVLSCTSVSDCWGSPSKDWLKNAWPIYN